MTHNQLQRAVEIAKSNTDLLTESSQIDIFDGFGLGSFKPVTVTVKQVAALIRWQCFQFNGGIDATELNNLAYIGKKKFLVC
jgi:hypothetical protein